MKNCIQAVARTEVNCRHLLVLAVVRFLWKAQVKWIIAGLVTESHVILTLARSFIAGTMFVAAVLTSAPFVLRSESE